MRTITPLLLLLACGDKASTDTSEPTDPVDADTDVDTDTDADTDVDTDTDTDPTADLDGDGFEAAVDCDDADSSVYPGAPERCDGVPNDCDAPASEAGLVTVDGTTTFTTIQEAVDAAVAGATVLVCDGTYTGNVTVDVDLTLASVGGAERTVLDAAGVDSAVRATAGSLTLEGLTLTGGVGSDGPISRSGGGVNAWAADALTLVDCVVQGNTADRGGGIVAQVLTLQDTIVDGNTSNIDGGGLYAAATLVATRSSITGNDAVGYGGGVALATGGTATLTDSTIEANTAELGGGLFAWQDGTVDAPGTVFATNTAASGAGVYLWSGALVGGTLNDNVATDLGGGAYLYLGGAITEALLEGNLADRGGGLAAQGAVTLTDVEVLANTATTSGGGLYLDEADVTCAGTTQVSGNDAGTFGGGLYLRDTTVLDGTIDGNTASTGAGAYVSGVGSGTTTVTGTRFDGNHALESGGGMAIAGPFVLATVSVVGNTSDVRAGGLYVDGTTGSATDLVVTGNEAADYGGGIYVDDLAALDASDATIDLNVGWRGAGIYVNGGATITVRTSVVQANGDAVLTEGGGGARVNDGVLISDASDWGDGAVDNVPDDVSIPALGQSLTGYAAAETFTCDLSGCVPTP